MTILLSDDEVVAIAASGGYRWPTKLPTVAVDDPREYAAALARGARSLRIRGMVEGEPGGLELSPSLAAFTLAARAAPPVVLGVVADPATEPVGGTLLVTSGGGDSAVLDLISPSGVHEWEATTPESAAAVVSAFLRDMFERGPSAEVAVQGTIGGSIVRVSRGEVRIAEDQPVREWAEAEARITELAARSLEMSLTEAHGSGGR